MMMTLKWDSADQIKQVETPVLFISGDCDSLVPVEMTKKLYENSKKAPFKDILIVPGGEHNNTFYIAGPAYTVKLTNFFNKCKQHYKRGLDVQR